MSMDTSEMEVSSSDIAALTSGMSKLHTKDDFGMLMLHSRLTEIGDAIMKENAKLDKINESRNDIEKTIASLKREPTPSNEVAIKNLEDIIINLNMDANPITEEIDALKKRYKEVNKDLKQAVEYYLQSVGFYSVD